MSLTEYRKKFNKYVWGMGLEHEMHLFHLKKNRKSNISSFTLYNGELARNRVLDEINLKDNIDVTDKDFELLSNVPFEKTGRLCNGKWVIKKVPFNMPEFITSMPITKIRLSGKDRSRTIKGLCEELIQQKNHFINLLKKDPITKKQIKKYGELYQYPFGMTSYLKYPESSNALTYQFAKDSKGKMKVREEYVGSYHITITLPYIQNKTTQKEFIEMHQNFANQLQWLEPLLLTSFFSCDEKAPGSKYDRVRGSFRVAIIGWGNFAGSDVRKLGEGIGRYSDIDSYWRKGLKLHGINKLKPCFKPSAYAKKEGGISTLSSNFRTFGDNENGERISGAGMTVGNGVEFRIFDQFNDEHLDDLVKFCALVAENSRKHKTTKYVYKNKKWINALQDIMKEGWCAKLKKGYVNDLRKMLGLKIKTESLIAYDVLNVINDELYDKHKNGDFFVMMNSYEWFLQKSSKKNDYDSLKPVLPLINFDSWVMGCMIKLNRNKKLLEKFNSLLNVLPDYFDVKTFEKTFFNLFNKKSWCKDVNNFIHMLFKFDYIDVTYNNDGTVKECKVLSRKTVKNFNKDIKNFFFK